VIQSAIGADVKARSRKPVSIRCMLHGIRLAIFPRLTGPLRLMLASESVNVCGKYMLTI